jgi:hypothetical protein
MTITSDESEERMAVWSFKNVPIAMVSITPMHIKNKLGHCIRNHNNPIDKPRIFAFILSSVGILLAMCSELSEYCLFIFVIYDSFLSKDTSRIDFAQPNTLFHSRN